MKVKEIMDPRVAVVHADNTVQEAAQKMKDLDVGPLPVCQDDRLVGIITDRDITVRSVAEGYDPWTTQVREVMSRGEIYSCYEDEDVEDAARVMRDKQVRRLPVLNRQQRLVGIVSLGDVAIGTGDVRRAGETLRDVSQPAARR